MFLSACRDERSAYTDTPVSGEVLILVDEAYQPMMQVQIDTFMELYQYAKINVRYLPEEALMQEFLNNDSVRLVVAARSLNKEEEEQFVQMKIIPRTTKIAVDALALVVNKSNPDTAFSYEQLGDIIKGKISHWKQINKTSRLDSMYIVFDKNGSCNVRFLKEHFLGEQSLPSNCYATNSNAAVMDYVNENPGAIGIISVNWISDRDNAEVNSFLGKINVAAISLPDTGTAPFKPLQPYQAYIALKKYPLTRDVVIISREGRNGLGTGFASFVAGDQGQRLIRLMGMLPATMPVRLVKVN